MLSTYHHHQAVARDPSKASEHAQRDAEFRPKITDRWAASGIRIALTNRFNARGTAEIIRLA